MRIYNHGNMLYLKFKSNCSLCIKLSPPGGSNGYLAIGLKVDIINIGYYPIVIQAERTNEIMRTLLLYFPLAKR